MSPIVSTIHQSRPGRAMRSAASIFDNFTPNLPSGMTLYRTTSFGNLLPGQVGNADGFGISILSANGAWTNNTDPTAPFGPGVTDIVFGEGQVEGGGTNIFSGVNAGHVRVYWAMSVFLSDPYAVHSADTGGEKFWYPVINTPGFPQQSTVVGITRQFEFGETSLGPVCSFWIDSQSTGPWSEWSSLAAGHRVNQPGKLSKGKWSRVECYAQLNTPGNVDGICKVWVDGVIALDRTAHRWVPTTFTNQSTFDGVRFTSTRGGGTSLVPVPSGGQFRRFDRLDYYGSTTF